MTIESLQPTIRRANRDEACALSDLALRSKGHWGYDSAFLDASRADLTVAAADIDAGGVFAAVDGDVLLGFYTLAGEGDDAELVDLFVAPEAIGQGIGRLLWDHAVGTATERGCHTMTFQSDPHAEGFYQAMGARRIGDSPSTVFPGRILPLMRFDLT